MILWSIDPGMSSGIFVGEYDAATPLRPLAIWQIEGGLDAFMAHNTEKAALWLQANAIAFEYFTPRPLARSYRSDELEPLRIEGFVRAAAPIPLTMQRPQAMLIAGGSGAPGKRAADDILRKLGWWRTGSQVGCKDANDANAATKHAIAAMRNMGHMPTIELIEALDGE